MQPTGINMEAPHQNINIGGDDLKTVKVYLNDLAHSGTGPAKPTYDNLILFLFLGILIIWAVVELQTSEPRWKI